MSVLVSTLLLVTAVACTSTDDDSSLAASSTTAAPDDGEVLREQALAVVEVREKALRERDRDAFLATVDPRAEAFAETQARWFDNLGELPLDTVELRLGDEDDMTRVAAEGDYQLPVELTLQLEGYDEHPVTQPQVYTFAAEGDELLLTSDRNVQSDALSGWRPAPWDVTAIEVRSRGPVLGVFDASTVESAGHVIEQITEAVSDLDGVVPTWSEKVVAYLIEDVGALDKMSLMDVSGTAGVAFTLPRRPGSDRVAAQRLALNPAAIDGSAASALTIRHEVAHVALGELDDYSPTWLVEGSAQYLALRSTPIDLVRFEYAAFVADHPRLPLSSGRDFYQVEPVLNYNAAAVVCTYLGETRGPATLWSLMRAFERERIVSQADIEGVLRAELGRTTRQLGQDARAWLLTGEG